MTKDYIMRQDSKYSLEDKGAIIKASSIIENAPYHIEKGAREILFVGNSGTCTCASSNSGPSCRAISSSDLEIKAVDN